MMAEILAVEDEWLTLQVRVKLGGPLPKVEKAIIDACNGAGMLATARAIKGFDTDGSPIEVGGVKFTSKGLVPKLYETPYGEVEVHRHVYQSSQGGKTYCPLEHAAGIIRNATPQFAQQLSHKYANLNAPAVCRDLEDNHHRKVAHSYVQDVADWVGATAQAQGEAWEYALPDLDRAVASVVVGLDGAFIPMRGDGYREAMVGTLSLYDLEGVRLHTVYIGEAPEHGKSTFTARLEREIAQAKKFYPDALYLGIADGAKNNWGLLERHTSLQLLDFFHATEYLADVAEAAFPGKGEKPQRETWLHTRCRQLKNDAGAADTLLAEMGRLAERKRLTKTAQADLAAAHTYFTNNRHRMDYAGHVAKGLPIGSGVTEAACKTLVKQRLCCSGMRWSPKGAKVVLSLRALIQSRGRWQQFWDKMGQFSMPMPV